jgi:hypothetical protein
MPRSWPITTRAFPHRDRGDHYPKGGRQRHAQGITYLLRCILCGWAPRGFCHGACCCAATSQARQWQSARTATSHQALITTRLSWGGFNEKWKFASGDRSCSCASCSWRWAYLLWPIPLCWLSPGVEINRPANMVGFRVWRLARAGRERAANRSWSFCAVSLERPAMNLTGRLSVWSTSTISPTDSSASG